MNIIDNLKTPNVKQAFDKLPREVQSAINSTDLAEKLRKIAKDNSLHLDMGAILEEEVCLVMLGITKHNDFIKNIKENLFINDVEANNIASQVNELIFKEIKEHLVTPNEPTSEHRDAILAEIEGPHNSEHGVFSNPNIPTATVAPTQIEKLAEKPIDIAPTPIKVEPLPANILETKMTSVVKSVPQTAVTPTPTASPNILTKDPYREMPV